MCIIGKRLLSDTILCKDVVYTSVCDLEFEFQFTVAVGFIIDDHLLRNSPRN